MIRLAKPWIDEAEKSAVAKVLESGMLVQGARVAEFERVVSDWVGRRHAIAVSSGTAALELALAALEIGPGGEVLCPALSWPSPAHAISRRGARPVLVDVDAHEWNTTGELFDGAVQPSVKAAIVIDQFGFPARADEIRATLGDIPIIEDAACALGSRFPDSPCGTLGAISCLSFHPRKVITTGEGGMCLTDEDEVADRLRVLRDHGRHPERGFITPAGNHRLTEIAAAMGIAQMAKLPDIIERRRGLAETYREALEERLAFQRLPAGSQCNYQTLGALLPERGIDREKFVYSLRERGIETGPLSYAIHTLGSMNGLAQHLPNAEAIAKRGVALPLHPTMGTSSVEQVIEAIEQTLP